MRPPWSVTTVPKPYITGRRCRAASSATHAYTPAVKPPLVMSSSASALHARAVAKAASTSSTPCCPGERGVEIVRRSDLHEQGLDAEPAACFLQSRNDQCPPTGSPPSGFNRTARRCKAGDGRAQKLYDFGGHKPRGVGGHSGDVAAG